MDMFVFELKELNTCKVLGILSEESVQIILSNHFVHSFDVLRKILQ